MSFALALAFLAAPQAAPPASTDTLQVAMTRGGVRLEFAAKPAPGSREIKTAFGVFYTPLDPVAIVLESPRRARWRSELETNPKLSLMPTIAALDADGRIAELIDMVPVLEARLLEDELTAEAEHRRDELIAASNAIAGWGERLDPLPGDLTREERLIALWKHARSAEGASALLSGSRLLAEVTPGGAGIGVHQLNISQLRKGMRSDNPYLRGIASQISGKQLIFDASQNAWILIASVEDEHVVARAGAADGIVRVWPAQAREYWTDILLRWEDDYRGRAGWHLVDHMPYAAAAPVVGVVAASGQRIGGRFDMGNLTLSVVSGRRKPSKYFGGLGKATGDGSRRLADFVAASALAAPAVAATPARSAPVALAAPAQAHCPTGGAKIVFGEGMNGTPGGPLGVSIASGLTNGSTAKVSKVSAALTQSLKRALSRLADDSEERNREAWIAWYEELLAN